MILETYFNSKKHFFTTFFTELEQVIRQLSIAVQLQIDQDYVSAKQLLAHRSGSEVENECKNMKARQPQLLMKIIELIYEHAKRYCNNLKPFQYALNAKGNSSINGAISQTPENIRMSKDKPEVTTGKYEQQPRVNIVNFSPVESYKQVRVFNPAKENISSQPSQRTNQSTGKLEKIYQPIHLMNKISKIRSSSTSKIINPGNGYSELHQSLNKKDYINQQDQNLLNKRLFEDSKEIERNQRLQYSNKLNKSHNRDHSIEENQILCEKLDQRIQQQALEILNKVKPKRSPHRRKQTQDSRLQRPSRVSKTLLDISKQAIPVWHGSRRIANE